MAEQSGKVINVLPIKTFNKKDGTEGKNQTIVIESVGSQYPTILALELNDKFADKIKVGEEGTFSFNVSSREYQGKFYTSANLWKWDKVGGQQASQPPTSNFTEDDNRDQNLPF